MVKDYVAVQYDLERRPITGYPAKLAKRLTHLHDISVGAKLLEVGAGRPDVLNGFRLAGIDVHGCDISKVSEIACKKENIPFKYVNLEVELSICLIHYLLLLNRLEFLSLAEYYLF